MKKIVIGIVIALVIVYLIMLILTYRSNFTNHNDNYLICTQEAKVCPDGSTVGRSGPKCEFAACPDEDEKTNKKMTEMQARKIAEGSCIKGGEALGAGLYNENSKTWWFDANLNATKEGCNPACVVSEDTGLAEINWRCTGLIVPKSISESIKKIFIEKYPQYSQTISIIINLETTDHARGSVSFVSGEPGGIWLAAKINGEWQVVHDGNGQIPCDLSKYGFPSEMLVDCS